MYTIKTIFILLMALTLIFSAACSHPGSNANEYTFTEADDGASVMASERGATSFYDLLPAKVNYNGKNIILSSVDTYQMHIDSKYSYVLYVIVTLDVGELEDDEIYWLRESDIDAAVYLTSESNDYDFDRMNVLGNVLITDQDIIQYVFTSSFWQENRYPFDNSEIDVAFNVKLEETYEHRSDDGEIHDIHKENGVHYSKVLPEGMPSPEEIKQPLYGYIAKWLEEEGQFYLDMMDRVYG